MMWSEQSRRKWKVRIMKEMMKERVMEGLLEHLQTAPATLWTAPNPFHRETLTLLLMSTQLKVTTVSGDGDTLL